MPHLQRSLLAAALPSLSLGACLAVSGLAACAATEPFPPAPTEVLVLVDQTFSSITVIPTGAPALQYGINLPTPDEIPAGIAARGGIGLVPLGKADAVSVVDLGAGTVLRTIDLAGGSGPMGAAMIDDSIGYVAEPGLDRVVRINYVTGDTASLPVGNTPQALVFARGKLFVLNGNLDSARAPLGPSWLTVVDPVLNQKASGVDSILLPGPGNAHSATVGPDGLLYVMNAGDTTAGVGRLSIVNPVTREELGNFGGFGIAPGDLATAGELLLISSRSEGVMTFDIRSREVGRGAGSGVAVPTNSSVAVGADGRVYAVVAGMCSGGISGNVRVLRASDLAQTGLIALTAECEAGALITTIPAAP